MRDFFAAHGDGKSPGLHRARRIAEHEVRRNQLEFPVTAFTAMQQIKSRSLRLDSGLPRNAHDSNAILVTQ